MCCVCFNFLEAIKKKKRSDWKTEKERKLKKKIYIGRWNAFYLKFSETRKKNCKINKLKNKWFYVKTYIFFCLKKKKKIKKLETKKNWNCFYCDPNTFPLHRYICEWKKKPASLFDKRQTNWLYWIDQKRKVKFMDWGFVGRNHLYVAILFPQ